MKTSKYLEELKTQSVADLSAQLVEAKKELFNLRFQNATNQLDNTSRIKEVRKNIARIQTIITEKEDFRPWKKEILEKHVSVLL